jgi:glycosyltransferase involved in cell wall biosynthesis
MNGGVAISAGNLGPGGVETHVRLISIALRASGQSVTVYGTACNWQAASVEQMRRAGVRFILPATWLWRARRLSTLWSLALWCLRPPQDCVSLYCIGAGSSHRWLKRLAGRNTFSIYHEIVSPPGPNSLAAECMRQLDAWIANSRSVAQTMATIRPVKPMWVIPFLTAPQRTSPPPGRPAPLSRDLRIGYLGRLEARKRPQVLVREWARLVETSPVGPAILHLYGDDAGKGLMAELQAHVRGNGLDKLVQFHGAYSHDQLQDIFLNLDLVLLPSEWEGLPLVLVEAMQHGVPFVATGAGGTAELAEQNPDVAVTGLSWEDFEQGLREFAVRLRAGQVDAQRLHNWVESRYGFDVVWPKWQQALLCRRNISQLAGFSRGHD